MRTYSNRRAIASRKPTISRLPAPTKAQARSRVSYGRGVLSDVDGRSRRQAYRDIVSAIASDPAAPSSLASELAGRFAYRIVRSQCDDERPWRCGLRHATQPTHSAGSKPISGRLVGGYRRTSWVRKPRRV
jgi:hypothetical protein